MEFNTREILNLKKISNYFYFCLGIATESLAVLTLMTIPLIISAIALWLSP
jgi:hypothetical protein